MTPVMRSTLTVSDAGLLARVASGDLDALGGLYDRHAADLLRFSLHMGATTDAEDIVQTTFLRALRLAASFDATAISARPWLFAIALRVLREHRRSFRRWANALFRLQQAEAAIAKPSTEARRDISRGLDRLSCHKRAVLVLAEVEEFSCPEIAAMLHIPVGTVWTRLHHARRELRAFLEGAGT